MADTSERIVILSALILLFIVIQSYSEPVMKDDKEVDDTPTIQAMVNASHPKITVNGTISYEEFPIPPPVGKEGDPIMHNVFVVDTNTSNYHNGIFYLQRDWQDDKSLSRVPKFYRNMFFVESQGNDTVGGLLVNEWVEAMEQEYLVEIRGYDMTTSIDRYRYCIISVTEAEIILYLNDSLRDENAWVTATVLSFEPSPNLEIIELSSEDEDIPHSLFTAIDKAILDAESVQVGPSIYPHESRRFAMPVDDVESIIRYFGEDIVEGRNAYEFFIGFLDYVISILIQFSIQVTS